MKSSLCDLCGTVCWDYPTATFDENLPLHCTSCEKVILLRAVEQWRYNAEVWKTAATFLALFLSFACFALWFYVSKP